MIGRLLVANRGEIARRVFRTCRDLGIETVAVFSDADADAPHVAEADHAVRLSGVRPADTYLSVEKIIEAARATGARTLPRTLLPLSRALAPRAARLPATGATGAVAASVAGR